MFHTLVCVAIIVAATCSTTIAAEHVAITQHHDHNANTEPTKPWYIPVYNASTWNERPPRPEFDAAFTFRDRDAPLSGWNVLFAPGSVPRSAAIAVAPHLVTNPALHLQRTKRHADALLLASNAANQDQDTLVAAATLAYSDDVTRDDSLSDNYVDVDSAGAVIAASVPDATRAASCAVADAAARPAACLRTYLCTLPPRDTHDVLLRTARAPLTPLPQHVYDARLRRALAAALIDLPCLDTSQGWWTYRVCADSVRQFHVPAPDTPAAERARYAALDFMIGTRIASHTLLQRANGAHVLRTRYVDGDVCELTGRPREVDVQWACGAAAVVGDVREQSACVYRVDVQLPRLCVLTAFRSRADINAMSARIRLAAAIAQHAASAGVNDAKAINDNNDPATVTSIARLAAAAQHLRVDDDFDWSRATASAARVAHVDDHIVRLAAAQLASGGSHAGFASSLSHAGLEITCRAVDDDDTNIDGEEEGEYDDDVALLRIPPANGRGTTQLDFIRALDPSLSTHQHHDENEKNKNRTPLHGYAAVADGSTTPRSFADVFRAMFAELGGGETPHDKTIQGDSTTTTTEGGGGSTDTVPLDVLERAVMESAARLGLREGDVLRVAIGDDDSTGNNGDNDAHEVDVESLLRGIGSDGEVPAVHVVVDEGADGIRTIVLDYSSASRQGTNSKDSDNDDSKGDTANTVKDIDDGGANALDYVLDAVYVDDGGVGGGDAVQGLLADDLDQVLFVDDI